MKLFIWREGTLKITFLSFSVFWDFWTEWWLQPNSSNDFSNTVCMLSFSLSLFWKQWCRKKKLISYHNGGSLRLFVFLLLRSPAMANIRESLASLQFRLMALNFSFPTAVPSQINEETLENCGIFCDVIVRLLRKALADRELTA